MIIESQQGLDESDNESVHEAQTHHVEEQVNRKRQYESEDESSLALDEQKSAFMALLKERNPSPFSMWDLEREKLMDDTRFHLVKLEKDRQNFFDEYIMSVGDQSTDSTAQKPKSKANDPEALFQSLLDLHVTKTSEWGLFSRRFARDKKFTALPRPERESMFRAHLKRLKEGGTPIDKTKKQQDSLKEREEQVRREMQQVDQERARTKRALIASESTIAFQDLLGIYAQIDMEYYQLLQYTDISRDHRYALCKNMNNQEVLFYQHVEHQFQTVVLPKFHQAIEQFLNNLFRRTNQSFQIDKQLLFDLFWESGNFESLKAPRSLLQHTDDPHQVRQFWFGRFVDHLEHLKRHVLDQLEQSIAECSVVKFQIKQVVNDLTARLLEQEKREPSEKEIWEYLDMDEFLDILNRDSRFSNKNGFVDDEMKQLVLKEHLQQWILQAQKEKGGALDRTIALAAGGSIARK